MIKVSCEVPYSILERSVEFNDYEYCLAHEFLKNKSYHDFYIKQKEDGRECFLDNSCFELGCSIDPEIYANIINELKPDVVFLPDCYTDDSKTAVQRIVDFKKSIEKISLSYEPIWCAVVHGKSLEDAITTWTEYTQNPEIRDFIKRIAVSKSLLLSQKEIDSYKKKWHLEDNPYVDFNRYLFLYAIKYVAHCYHGEPLHLLGNYGAFEFKNEMYKDFNIVSVDSSHPVMTALDPYTTGKSYSEYNTRDYGIQYRDKHCVTPVLANNMDRVITEDELKKIKIYVQEYKDLVNHNI